MTNRHSAPASLSASPSAALREKNSRHEHRKQREEREAEQVERKLVHADGHPTVTSIEPQLEPIRNPSTRPIT
jgi:hypothetical protein